MKAQTGGRDRGAYRQGLTSAVVAAVKETLTALSDGHPGESWNGYALLTDDGVAALGHVASTREYVQSHPEPYVRFEPVEWIFGDGCDALDEANRLIVANLRAATSDELFAAHVDDSWAAAVEALLQIKSEGLFPDEVFLTVISTDPCQESLKLEHEAVRALNSPDMYTRWVARLS